MIARILAYDVCSMIIDLYHEDERIRFWHRLGNQIFKLYKIKTAIIVTSTSQFYGPFGLREREGE